MPLNHTFSLTMCNTKLIIKLAFMTAILVLIAFAVLSTTVMPVIRDLVEIISSTNVRPEDFINHPFVTLRTQIIDKCVAYLRQSDWRSMIGIIVAVYCCVRFFLTIPQLPLTKVIYSKMSTGYDIGLFNAFVSTGFQNLLLSLILSLVTSAINLGLLTGFMSLIGVSFRANAYVAIPFIIILFIAAYSAKSCLLSQWLPEICSSQTKNIFIGMKNAVKGTFVKFRKNFLCYFTLNVIWVAIFTATFVPSFGAIPLIGIPVFMVMRAILSVTLNFSYHRKKYFVDNGTTVYTPEKLF
ncbi:MAG: hypothetical protein ACI4M8_01830 [Christensenellales bacterium]